VIEDSHSVKGATIYLVRNGNEQAMRPHVTVLTLGVDDLEKSMKFYQRLGWHTEGVIGKEFEHGPVAMFNLKGGLILALYPRKDLAWDAEVPLTERSSTEFSIGHNVNSKDEVNEVMKEAETAGAKIVKRAQPAFWGGYSGYFQDPDSHLWEVVWNPQIPGEG